MLRFLLFTLFNKYDGMGKLRMPWEWLLWSVNFLFISARVGRPIKKPHEGLHRLKKVEKEIEKTTTKPSLTIKLKYCWRFVSFVSFHLPYHIIRERKNFNGYSKRPA